MTKLELLAATALTFTFASPAFAQDAGTVTTTDDTSQTTPAQDDEFGGANDIVVTATRRDQTVQDVPIAITAVGPELLSNAGVTDIRDLEQLAPSLQTTTGQSSALGSSLSIRGVGTAGDNPGFEPAVGVFIDGVFRARAGIAIAELPELERVEILRGPQGTLFGRNTSAGALSVITAGPKFELGGYVEGSYGNYDAFELKGAITGPVSETLALRVDAGYRKRDGYIDDANSDRSFNNIDRYYVRGQALYDTSTMSFRLIADYYETDEQCCGAVSWSRGALPTAAIQAVAARNGVTGIYTGPPSDRIMATSRNRDLSERVRDYGISGEFNFDLGGVNLTSITAYRDWRVLRNQDIDFSGIDRAYRDGYKSEIRDFTQEFRVQGSLFDGALDFLVGAFYLNEDLTLRDTVRIGNDGNAYVDTILNIATRSAQLPTGAQFFGTLGTAAPLFGQVLLAQNPIVAPPPAAGLPPIFLSNIAPPGSPLFNLLNSPLPGAVPGQGNNNDDFRVRTNALALFTHNIFNITDSLSLTVGARWNYERKELDATLNSNLGSCAFFNQVRAGDPTATTYANLLRGAGIFNNLFLLSCNPAVNTEFNGAYEDERSESRLTGTVKLGYKINPNILVYGSYDRGFKSGGYNLDRASFDSVLLGGNGPQATDLEFGAETVDSYEIGFKSSITPQFTFNVSAFYQKYRGLQSLVFSGNNFIVTNIDDATGKGVELESVIQPSRHLVFRLGYSYLDAGYDESNNFAGGPLSGLEGRQFLNQPKHVVSAAMTWTPPITNRINGLFHVDMRYNSDVLIACPGITTADPRGCNPRNAGGAPRTVFNDGYPLVSARVGIQSDDRKLGLEFFVENLTNQYYNITGFAVPEQTGNYAVYPSTPRFYGVRARFGF